MLAREQTKLGRWESLPCDTFTLHPPRVSTMDIDFPQPARDGALLSSLTASIDALSLAEQNSGTRPTKTVFGSAGTLLTTIRVRPCSAMTTS